MRVRVDEKIAKAAVYGGSFLGGGGGGDLREGLKTAELALSLGELLIVSVDELSKDSYIATASIVGAPAAKERYVTPRHMIRSFELLLEAVDVDIRGIISSENGGASITNGWIPAVLLELPIVDAPADGRAHPTGVMGSMGLHKREDYISIQACAGGDIRRGRYIELVVRGSLENTDKIIREASVRAGGMVAVARNPVERDYVAANAAVGAVSKAISIGEIMIKYKEDAEEMSRKIIEYLGGGKIIGKGVVLDKILETRGGYDIGRITIRSSDNKKYIIRFWNEYMSLETEEGFKIASFPDLITTIDIKTSLPLTSAEINIGDEIIIIAVPKENIPLGSGVKDPELISEVWRVLQ
jgi:hypothetical protein